MSCAPSIPAGARRHKIILQAQVRIPDGQGGFSTSWIDVRPIWCSKKEISDWERKEHDQLRNGALFKFRALYVDAKDVDPAIHRLNQGGKLFNIRGVEDEEEQHTVIKITAEEGVLT